MVEMEIPTKFFWKPYADCRLGGEFVSTSFKISLPETSRTHEAL